MVQLILIRPGCTEYDEQARIQGTLDIPLCEAGRREAQQTAERLRAYLPAALYCSPAQSAEETAAVIGELLSLKPKTLDGLQNLNQGLWQGLLVEEVQRKQPKVYKQWNEHPETVRPPEGETLAEAVERVEDVLEKLARKHRTGAIGLVVPEPLASIVRYRIEGTELGDLWHAANGCRDLQILHLEPSLAAAGAGPNGKPSPPGNGSGPLMFRGNIVDQS